MILIALIPSLIAVALLVLAVIQAMRRHGTTAGILGLLACVGLLIQLLLFDSHFRAVQQARLKAAEYRIEMLKHEVALLQRDRNGEETTGSNQASQAIGASAPQHER